VSHPLNTISKRDLVKQRVLLLHEGVGLGILYTEGMRVKSYHHGRRALYLGFQMIKKYCVVHNIFVN
jgi:hypothetical protein